MSLIKNIIAACFIFILFGCGASNVENKDCLPTKNSVKIRVAVTGNTAFESENDFKLLNKIINEDSTGLNIVIIPPVTVEIVDPANTESVRLYGEDKNCLLVFLRAGQNKWNIITIESKLRDEFSNIIPPVTGLNNDEIGLFLSAFENYISGNYSCALDRFTSLKKKIKNDNSAAQIDFWNALTLIRLGKNKVALAVLNNLAEGDQLSDTETKGAAYLAMGKFLITVTGFDPHGIEKPLKIFSQSSELLRGLNNRYWAISQMESGSLTLFLNSNSNENLVAALNYFENSGTAFVYPKDELDIARSHYMKGNIYLELAQDSKEANNFIAVAISNFLAAKDIFGKYDGMLADLEDVARKYEAAIELQK